MDDGDDDDRREGGGGDLVLQRHYGTIGVGDVFVVPPLHPLPFAYLQQQQQKFEWEGNNENGDGRATATTAGITNHSGSFDSWEIVGDVKSGPEDFVVREIGLLGLAGCRSRCRGTTSRSAKNDDDNNRNNSDNEKVDDGDDGSSSSSSSNNNDDDDKKKKKDAPTDEATTAAATTTTKMFAVPGLSVRQMQAMRVADTESASADDDVLRGHSSGPSTFPAARAAAVAATERRRNPPDVAATGSEREEGESAAQRHEENRRDEEREKVENLLAASPLDVLRNEARYAENVQPGEVIEALERLNRLALDRFRRGRVSGGDRRANSQQQEPQNPIDSPCEAEGIALPQQPDTYSFVVVSNAGNGDAGSSSCGSSNGMYLSKSFNRGYFHRAVRRSFPLLHAESLPRTEDRSSATSPQPATTGYRILVSLDTTFRDIAPSLYEPWVDLPPLYAFLKNGVSVNGNNNDTVVRLRLDLPRSERRFIHQTVERATNCSLVSRTVPDYPLSRIGGPGSVPQKRKRKAGDGSSGGKTTAAVVVSWAKSAARKANKKRKREPRTSESSKSRDPFPNTLFVLKKTKLEHLNAIQILSMTLKCRQSDIGLGGIKDMKAVTFQFCTLSNFHPRRLLGARSALKEQRIEIGCVHKVDWQLQKGDLLGNHFEIVIRNVKRIRVRAERATSVQEDMVPCDLGHLQAMFDRLQKNPFVNFYGEQRVGAAGDASIVGVRPFEIGKAMLRRDFTKAVDLLLTGRLVIHGTAGTESEEVRAVRRVWKESGGDADATWKILPNNRSVLLRERQVLKGLKRYGKDDPLAAIRCLHFNERIFFITAYQAYVWNVMATERIKRYGTEIIVGDLVQRSGGKDEVEFVTSASKSLYELGDIVLPLPGYSVRYPGHSIGDMYHQKLSEDGVVFSKSAPLESTAKGSYRRLFVRAENMSFDTLEDGEKELHMKLRFSLPTGSYATMFLRELMLTTVVRG